MKYAQNEIDVMVFLSIQKISENPDKLFIARPKTIASFLKGTKNSPFASYYKNYPTLCGKMILTEKEVIASCKRLMKNGNIEKVESKGSYFYKAYNNKLFLDLCSKEELNYINSCTDYVKSLFPTVICINKPLRYGYSISEFSQSDIDFDYSWFWFTRLSGKLIFKYKINQNDNDKSLYENNIVIVNKNHIQTIKNVIFLLTR